MKASASGKDRVQAAVAGVVDSIAIWREEHRRATFAEMEVAVEERLSVARAAILEGLAMETESRQLSSVPVGERSRCPECGAELAPAGDDTRDLMVMGGHRVHLKREAGVCVACGGRFFPSG